MRRSPARSRSMRRNPIRAAKRTPCVRRSYWGRGGAGMMFVCSEDRTVLLLLRAEWVEQGGTWGVPGGGIGEGFFSTPMEPIDDPEVFLRKAVQEVEEECGSLPPGFSEAQILGTTQYEDCGFRYRTFIVDVTAKQKAAWRLVSEDDETDAFVWFPWDDVLSGQPLDDAEQHFGVVFTMKNLPATVSARFGGRARKVARRPRAVAATVPVNPLFPDGTMIAYHGGHALVGGKFDLSYVGQGEGSSFPGIYFTNLKDNAEGYAKHAPLGENYVHTVRLDARGFYAPTRDVPAHLGERLRQLVKDIGADNLPREGHADRYGLGRIGQVIQKLGPVEGPKALMEIGITGQVRFWGGEDLFEVAVMDPSVITLLSTEKVAVPYSLAGRKKAHEHTYDPLFDKGPAPLPKILNFLHLSVDDIERVGFRVPPQARTSPEAFVAWATAVEVPPGKREEDFPENLRLLDEADAAYEQGDYERSGALQGAYEATKLREGIYDREYVERTIKTRLELMQGLIRSGSPREIPKFRNPLSTPVAARFARSNPMRFDLRYTPEEADRYRDSRAVRSILSPVLRQKNITRMANTPHNFVVVVQEDGEGSALPLFEDAVTLSLSLRGVHNNDFDYAADEDKRVRESLYTAFTLLHRLGDVLYEDMIFGGSLYAPEKRPSNPVYAEFYKMADAHLEILEEAGWAPSRQKAYAIYTRLLGESVNSKMVREGYSGQWDQAFADLFPLCELTPPSRPLLLPLSAQADGRSAERTFNEQIVPDFNVRFRAFYNRLIPSLYGTAKRI